MIVKHARDLPRFDADEMLTVDCETTSFDDEQDCLRPFNGCRIAGVAVCTMDGRNSWYVPMRHRDDPSQNVYFPNALAWLKDLLGSGRDIVNHNIKFDAKFWRHDDCKVKGRIIDTMIMARLWNSDLLALSLDYLTGGGKDKRAKSYLKSIRSKDWGRVPVEIMGPYAENDVIKTAGLFRKFRKGMPAESIDVWNTEIELTKHLVDAEMRGFRIDVHGIKETYANLLRRMMELQQEIDKLAGCEVDCLSSDDLTEVLVGRMGLPIISYTKPTKTNPQGNPQWNRASLTQLNHPIGELIKEYKHLSYFTSTFCEGWLKRLGDDGRLHADFQQAAAMTGRMASKEPCVTNIPPEAEMFILADEGCGILGFDYSQIEYRIFAHYANDEKIIKAYKDNPDCDYHQMLADWLGVPRKFAKSLNFSFIYGMGKNTLLQTIAGIIAVSRDETEMVEKLISFGVHSGTKFSREIKDMDFSDFKTVATGIYNNYHRMVPTIKRLTNRVSNVIKVRGWLRNYMGRVYKMQPRFAYKGVNYLVQGSAADIFKDRLNATLNELNNLGLITSVYDSSYFNVPLEEIPRTYIKSRQILEDFNLRVPLLVSPSVSQTNLSACVKFKKVEEISSALKESLTKIPDFKRRTIRAADFIVSQNS